MRDGTRRLPGRCPESCHVHVSIFLSDSVYMEAGRFSSRPAQPESRFQQQSRLEPPGTIFAI